jgi:hypothetical protein
MTMKIPTDEELMAYADGALEPAEAARLKRLVDADPALAAKVAMFRQTRDLLREARGPLAAQPVPDGLRQSIEAMIAEAESNSGPDTNVVDFARRKSAPPLSSRPWSLPLAASLAAVVAGLGGYIAGQGGAGVDAASYAAVGSLLPRDVAAVLSTAASGTSAALRQGQVKMIATVRVKGGELCREFEIDEASGQTVVGIGCREPKGWRLDIAVAAPSAQDGFAPASSLNAIDNFLGMIEASEPLDASEEAKALAGQTT